MTKEAFLSPIGLIRSPFKKREGAPIQPSGAKGVKGEVVLDKDLEQGLDDLDGFSHIYLLYEFDRSRGYDLKVTPFLDKEQRGVFATRAPRRPVPIGLSVVKLLKRKGNVLEIENVDVLDNTPLLDIKPYVPDFDAQSEVRTGWMEGNSKKSSTMRADDRFK